MGFLLKKYEIFLICNIGCNDFGGMHKKNPPLFWSGGRKNQYFLDSCASASSRLISPELHFAMICTSLSLSL